MKYKVAAFRFTETRKHPRYIDAMDIKETYGLPHDVEEIIEIWNNYSDMFAASWLIHDKESVESAFNVVLEEIK